MMDTENPDDGADLEATDHEPEGLADRVDALEAHLEDVGRKVDFAQDRVVTLRSQNRELRDRVDALEAENEDLRAEVEQLHEQTDLLELLRDVDGMTVEERAALCVQTLYHEAAREQEKDTKDAATAAMDYKKAGGVFRGRLSRDQIYRTFERVAELVDDEDVIRYIRESRNSDKNSRLVLSLEKGDLPPTIAGHEINPENRESVSQP
jgi:chromosome segregation ATPase